MKKFLLLSIFSLLSVVGAWADDSSEENRVVVNGICYLLNDKTKTAGVTYSAREDIYWDNEFYTGDVVVPEKITYKGKEYTVTEIAQQGFESQYNLVSVDLPSTITKIGEMAMYKNISLLSITCRALVPPETLIQRDEGDDRYYLRSFDDYIPESVILFVPAESLEAYKTAITWERFTIRPIGYEKKEVDGLWYIVNIDDPEHAEGKAELTYNQNANYEGDVTINPTITDTDGNVYSVTAIGDGAFKWQWNMTSIELPETIESLGSELFEGCNNLETIECHAATPPTAIGEMRSEESGSEESGTEGTRAVTRAAVAKPTFSDWCYDNVKLNVPQGSLEAYKSVAPWCNFKTIVDNVPTSIAAAPTTDRGLQIVDGKLYADGQRMQVYDAMGRIVYDGSAAVQLQRGIYLVKIGNRVVKVQI